MASLEKQFAVYLHTSRVGTLVQVGNYNLFFFEESYLNDPGRAVLGLGFEDQMERRHTSHLKLPPWFSNLLPEGRLRDWIAQKRKVSPALEMELLAQVGHDLPGAVRVLPADEPLAIDAGELPGAFPLAPQKSPPPLWRFSLAGVGIKFSMVARGERLVLPATGLGGDWIVKLPTPEYPFVPLNEFAMMTLARKVGIEVPDIRLIHREQVDAPDLDKAWTSREELAFAIRRFDRGTQRELIHIEDLAQVRGFYPDQKYAGSFETVANLFYRGRDVSALEEFSRRLAFNSLIGNEDAHLKNWSLIYRDPQRPTISPAYDLVSTVQYLQTHELALKWRGTRDPNRITLSSFGALQRKIKAQIDLQALARETAEKTRASFAAVFDEVPAAEAQLRKTRAWLTDCLRRFE